MATKTETRGSQGTRNGLFSLFVDRPILTLMVTSALFLVGVISFAKLPLRFVPEGLSENQVRVWIPVRQDMPPREVEEKIVRPLEEQLRTIAGVKSIRSDSSNSRAFVMVALDETMEPSLAAAEVRDRLQRARMRWPAGVDRYFTWREDAASVPLAFFQMLAPARNPEWDFLIEEVVRPRLEAVDGVGRVDVWGTLDETVRIWFDRDRLVAHRVDYRRLIQRLSSDNFTAPLGELDDGERQHLLRLDSKFRRLADIENFPVRTGLRLADIARVERVPQVRDRLSRFNGKYTYSGLIRAAAGVNPVDASRNLHAAVERLHEDPQLRDLEFRFLFDQGEMITQSLETLLSTSLQGGLLALVSLFFFLRNLRATIAIALAIPLALLVDGAWLYFTGDTLNVLTMAGMTLAVGMVVDNSVVVLENIRRLREQGTSPRDAAVQGAREVGLAVSLATLTTVVVILPMVFMGSAQMRTMLGSVGIPLSVALVGSLLVALLLLPSGMRHLGGARFSISKTAGHRSLVAALLACNHMMLGWALRHRLAAVLLSLALLSSTGLPIAAMEFSAGRGSGMFDRGDVSLYLEMPLGMDLTDVEKEVRRYERFVEAHRKEWRVESVSVRFSRTHATVNLTLEKDVPAEWAEQLRPRVLAAWPRRPGVRVTLRDRGDMFGGDSEERDENNFVVRLYGRDSEYLMGLARRVEAMLSELPEVETVEIPQMDRNEEVVVRFDRERMQQLGVQPEVMFGTVNAGLQGQVLSRFEERGREILLVAEFDRGRKPGMLDLKGTRVFSSSGAFQRLEQLSHIGRSKALGSIRRVDGRTNVTIVGRRAAGVGALEMNRKLAEVMNRVTLPRGYTWSEESLVAETRRQMGELLDALLLGVVLVFLLMGVLFESVIRPLAIVFTVLFAALGAMWALFVFAGRLDPMAFVGLILLAGIVVNNGIVLLDCIHRLRTEENHEREAAILEGTRRRMRAIVMTAVTTILGLLPMALFGESSERGGVSYVTMAIAVAGGLAVATLFTAFAVPLAYTLLDDLSGWFSRCRAAATPRSLRPTARLYED